MSTKIGPNKYQLIGKLIFQIVLIGILALFIIVTIYPRGNSAQSVWLLPVFGTLFLVFNIVIFIQLLFLPIGATIDGSEIVIKYLLLKSKYLLSEDIDTYTTTLIFTKSSEYKGVLIHLLNGKQILLSDFNLKDYNPILTFLEKLNIKFNGQEKFKFISYYSQGF